MRLSALLALLIALPAAASAPRGGDLAALVAATPAGGTLELPAGATYRVATTIVLDRPIRILGHGAHVAAADEAGIAGAVLASDGVNGVVIEDLQVDANIDRNGADYGLWIRGGSGHRIVRTRVSNSAQACILLEDASGTVADNVAEHCGRELTIRRGGAANNHGIMVAALTRAVSGVTISGNIVSHAYRKGITTYARAPGTLAKVTIAGNHIDHAGLGGIFVANAPQAQAQQGVVVRGNIARSSYVGIEVDNIAGLTLADNVAQDMRDRDGRPGAEGLLLHRVNGGTVTGMVVRNSGSGGISVIDSRGVRLVAPRVADGNSGGNGYAPGIQLRNSRDVSVEAMSIVDTRPAPGLTHGFVEIGPDGANRSSVQRMQGIARPLLRAAH